MINPSDQSELTDGSTAERLISVAGSIFAQKGVDATVREICSAAGCSVAAINYHFGDKHNLYVRCVQTACEQKQKLFPVPKFSPSVSASDQLKEFLNVVVHRLSAKSELSWQNTLMLREVLAPSDGVAETLSTAFRKDFRSLDELLASLLGSANSEHRRKSLAVQILARCLFLRTGGNLCAMVGLDVSLSADPAAYASELSESILQQIRALQSARDE